MSTMEDWVRMYGEKIMETFPHHLVVVWYPRGEWAINADNLRVDHVICLMQWLDEQLRNQNLTTSQRYHIYRGFGYSRMRAWLNAVCRP